MRLRMAVGICVVLVGCTQHGETGFELVGSDLSPVGTWSRREAYDWTVIRVVQSSDGTLRAELHRETDFASPFEHESAISWSDEGWSLETPHEYFPTHLHPAEFEGEPCLVDGSKLEHLTSLLHFGGAPWARTDEPWRDELAFRRAADGLLEERRSAWRARAGLRDSR